jgi:hypothetical protein
MAQENKPTTFKPITKPPKAYELGAFDIEGVGGPDGFIVAGVLTDIEYQTFTHPLDLIEHIRQRKYKSYRFFAHNLTYDVGILEPWFSKEDYPLLINGSVFKYRIARGSKNPRFLADSALFASHLPLRALGEKLNFPKLDTPEVLINYNPKTDLAQRDQLARDGTILKYLKRDNEIVLAYMHFFQNTINQLGGQMQFTLASTAMDLFRRKYLKQEYMTPFVPRNDFAREAYYGGRTEPFKTGKWCGVNGYDINSLYPYVMYHYAYPHPNYLIGPVYNVDPKLIYDYEGVSHVKIKVPDCHIPPLPYHHNQTLYFPTGILKGYYTHCEIRNALENGCELLDVYETLYSTEVCYPFQDYVSELYALRQQLKAAHDPTELVIKIMLNSLYGKFAQRTDAGLQEIHPITWWLDGRQNISVEYRVIDDRVYVVVPKLSRFQPQYVNVLWGVYITSYARITLYNYMKMVGDSLIYSDTDSLYINGELPISTDLGALKLEKEGVDIEVYGPKAYRIFKDGKLSGVKCKGVPHDNRNEYLTTGQTTFTRPIGYLEASHLKHVNGGGPYYPSAWREVTKVTHSVHPKRRLVPLVGSHLDQCLTHPHQVSDLPS